MYRFIAAAVAAMFCFAAVPAFAATTGVVRGNVTVKGAPRAGVHVVLTGEGSLLQATTDSAGAYVFSQVPFGNYVLTAKSTGVAERSLTVSVSSDQVLT